MNRFFREPREVIGGTEKSEPERDTLTKWCRFRKVDRVACVVREQTAENCHSCLVAQAERRRERICERCGVDRMEVHQSLHEGPASANYDYAVYIVENCPACEVAISEAERRLQEVR